MADDAIPTPLSCFPLKSPRGAQVDALDFLWKAITDGYEDIVLAAPTGIGKTGIGAAFSLWSSTLAVEGWSPGSYYLVTQKMLQDQIEADFPAFVAKYARSAASVRSASDYTCRQYGTCDLGGQQPKAKMCQNRKTHCGCPYLDAKSKFEASKMAVTNYPYLFTEHSFSGALPGRVGLVADECHTLEKQITNFVELVVNEDTLLKYAPSLSPLPHIRTSDEFVEWLDHEYRTSIDSRVAELKILVETSGGSSPKMVSELSALITYQGRLTLAVNHYAENQKDWVFWADTYKGAVQYNAKPIESSPFVDTLIKEMGSVRLYMSAYPGPKGIFCRSLGLDPRKVAWLDLDSPFPVENRPVFNLPVGSMGRQYQETTMPVLLRMCDRILGSHANEKGLIHCHSYGLGKLIFDQLSKTRHRDRILFPENASQRRSALETHVKGTRPTVILSPSITEGYSFNDDLARFQIIAKVPYPYLGDKQVSAKKNRDPDWYTMQTAMTIIQACGRIVRSEVDHGKTYILDSDFERLVNHNPKFFPSWFTKSIKKK